MNTVNPCLSCGACCAHFRVSFFWGEAQSAGGNVPDQHLISINPTYVAMRGTQQQPVRCTALEGEIGQKVSCTIYAQRSTSCRDFKASWQDGGHNPNCDTARIAHGLPPLERPCIEA